MREEQIVNLIIDKIKAINEQKNNITIAIDGRCASGKTTIARRIQMNLPCNIVHMDDFFLRPKQRTQERYNMPGGNVDYERFLEEVVPQLKSGGIISYEPFSCKEQKLMPLKTFEYRNITIVEGSYCCQPRLQDVYDYRCFLTVSKEQQLERIENRNGRENLEQFKKKWIPLEERYLNSFDWKNSSDDWFDTTE